MQILKQDWPHKWKTFIPDIVGASRTSETLCENCMVGSSGCAGSCLVPRLHSLHRSRMSATFRTTLCRRGIPWSIMRLLTCMLPLSQVILKLLSEEVFDFSRGELTQAKTKELKTSLNADFRLIHELSLWVLNAGARPDLTR